jgi:microcystin-dependent protein
MAEPFLGEVRIFSFNFAPKGWALCNGQILPINQNQALFALLGTTFGGNGQTTFALPNMQGRCIESANNIRPLGTVSGEQAHTLLLTEMPTHTHQAQANDAVGTQIAPNGKFWARESRGFKTFAVAPTGFANTAAVATVGGSQPHQNMMPYLTLNFSIALQGIFPSQN